jgi:hypothetical protein
MAISEKRTQVYLPIPQHRVLQTLARRRRVSMAAIVREALAEYAAQHMGSSESAGSDPLEDLIGCFEGESDLSSNHDDLLYPNK